MRNYRAYTDNDVIVAAKEVKSIAGLLNKLGLKPAGGNYIHVKKTLQRLNVEVPHWTGMGWSKGQQLKDWSKYTNVLHLKKHLLKLRGHICQLCNLSEWFNEPIKLEVHHKDGDRTNNELSNLELLCCNCHATTDNWRNKKQLTNRK